MTMYSFLHFVSVFSWIATVSGTAQLLTFVDGSIGNVLGTSFGAPGTNATYDYVIVGGGNAGLTIATRLASDPNISVAVVEAGGFYETDNGNKSVVPGYANYYTGSDPTNYNPLIDWGFVTVPQTVCIRARLDSKARLTVEMTRRDVQIARYITPAARLWVVLPLETI